MSTSSAGRRRSVIVTAITLALCCAAASTSPAQAAGDTCPNAAIRAQQGSEHLPDCRAWEKVSPDEKNSGDIYYQGSTVRTAPDGKRVAYVSGLSFGEGAGGAPRVSDYIADRGSTGWSTRNVSQSGAPDPMGAQTQIDFGFRWFSPDLSDGVFLRNDSPDMDRNIYLRNFAAGSSVRLSPPALSPLSSYLDPFTVLFARPEVGAVSDDGRHVLFESLARLTADAPEPNGSPRLYEWTDGTVRLAGILPADEGGGAAAKSIAGSGIFRMSRTDETMSADGSRIYFTVPDDSGYGGTLGGDVTAGEIYLRTNGATTTHVSASQRTDCAGDPTCGGDGVADPVPDPDGPGNVVFVGASRDGSVVFMRTCRKLTDDATATCAGSGTERNELYRYEVGSGRLEDMVTDPDSLSALDTIGVSDDGDYGYFTGKGNGTPVYVWHEGEMTRVGLAGADYNYNGSSKYEPRTSAVSSDGRFLLWLSSWEPSSGQTLGVPGLDQVYLYDAQSGAKRCVSCQKTGPNTGPSGVVRLQNAALTLRRYDPLLMDVKGKAVYFRTSQALVPEDVNGRWDVYQYDIATGRQSLISSGTENADADLGDVTPDGSSVFFVTAQDLVGSDDDGLRDLYVARVNGGVAELPPAAERCAGDGCQGGHSAAPSSSVIGSLAFVGSGDAASPGRGASVTVSRLTTVRGSAAKLNVTVPSAGSISVSGASVRGSKRSVSRAATYTVALSLSAKAKRTLARKKTLKVSAKVTFTPTSGVATSRTVSLTFKQPAKAKAGRAALSHRSSNGGR